MEKTAHSFPLFLYCLSLLAVLAPASCKAQSSQQLLVLPELRYLRQEPDASGENDSDYRASLDLLYALDINQYRFFAEFIATDEKSELARLHLGYKTRAGTTFWLGRFQLNQGYWNKTFHFRNYIQSSIQPPGIAAYEREDGALPVHFSGLDIRHQWALSPDATLQLEAGFGAGTKLEGRRLDGFDLLDPDGGRKPSTSVRLSYLPGQDTDTEFGIFYVDNRMPMRRLQFIQNKQRVSGGYANTRFDALRLYGALYWIDNELKTSAGRQSDHFYSAWLQGDYHLYENWTPYLRIEHSNGDSDDPYASLFPAFVRDRKLAGLRWDFLENQAFKIEYASTDFLREDSSQWAFQWSMIFP
ncbi:MAG TPA: hypothetical protein ENK49_09360 [Gammaproteobacteria bacterium]|nr:hypothetical protein [Gammaproteobacteria bacterium]